MTDDRSRPSGAQASPQPAGGDSIVSLIHRLTEQGAHLAQQHADLLRAEVRETVTGLKQGVAAMAGAAVVAIAGLGVLLMGLAYALAEVMDLWLATVIVALVTLLVAFLMFLAGRKRMPAGSLDLHRSRETIQRAPAAITGHTEGPNA